ncbi:MAG: HAD-IIIA family hydrolase [Agathobacter sp.]|nr:HAD-IIIA family hydrolase [Agathobacter sp.]
MKLQELLKFEEIVVQCHDNPDADAIASGFGIYQYCKDHGKKVSLIYGGNNIIRKNNLTLMVDCLKIPIEHVTTLTPPELLVTVDCQYGAGNVTHFNAQNVAVIDHHRLSVKLPELHEVKSALGACSTLVWQMLKKAGYDVNQNPYLATALYYGLYMDTGGFMEISHPLDRDLRDDAKFEQDFMVRFQNANLSLDELEMAGAALMQYDYNEEHRFAVVKVGACDPNLLGVISDLVLEVDAVDTCLVFSVLPVGVKISVRSCIKEAKANEMADMISKGIGSGGGHKRKAGGQIQGELLCTAYKEFCEEKGLTPRMELDESGKRERPTASAIKFFLVKRMEEYFDNTMVIDETEEIPELGGMKVYREKSIPMGYIYVAELFSEEVADGKKFEIATRSLEGDATIQVEKDSVLLIGAKGNIIHCKKDYFEENFIIYEQKYEAGALEYEPRIRNNAKGRALEALSYAKTCVSKGSVLLQAKQLSCNVKLFNQKHKEDYMRGMPGDYLAVSVDEPQRIMIIEKKVFEEEYRLMDAVYEQEEIKAVIFDLDGTLLNTLEDMANSLNVALEANGLPTRSIDEVRKFVGNGIRNLVIRAVPDGIANPAFEKTFQDFQEYYDKHYKDKTDAYPGIRMLLEELKNRGIAMAIVSNKIDSAVKKLRDQYFAEYIQVAIGEKIGIARKPAPDTALAALKELGIDRKNAIYVGDSDVDIETAQNAGMNCVSITWGFRDTEFLKEHGASTIIDRPEELLTIVAPQNE